jgi:hypothetical protein
MLKFKDLTTSQKSFIVRTLELFPSYAEKSVLGAKDIHASYYELKDTRSSTGEKLGYPNWLQSNNRVGRGSYEMPWPTAAELSDFAKGATTKPVKQPKVKVKAASKSSTKDEVSRLEKIIADFDPIEDTSDAEFLDELRANGINV